MSNKKVAFYTLGCKVNQYETEAMSEKFIASGYEVVNHDEVSDYYIINTCTVTAVSDKKSRQFIRRSKKMNPNAFIAVVGCYAQISPEEVMGIEGVNLILGTDERAKIVEYVEKSTGEGVDNYVKDIMTVNAFEEMTIDHVEGKTRAFVKIQEGCNQYCSYCIIPYARGPVRSRAKDQILEEIKRLVNHGYKEFVLTGIHVASYGVDLLDTDLTDIVASVSSIQGVERLRLSSIDPRAMTEAFLTTVSQLSNFCHHFHLSLQSGCNTVLKRMNRKYTTEEYSNIVDRIRELMPDASITTDIIVGFPGETDLEFDATYAFVEKIGFAQVHVFKYSPREGTKAAVMSDQIKGDIKTIRSQKLMALVEDQKKAYLNKFLNRTMSVLVEQVFDEERSIYEGLTENYMRVTIPLLSNMEGEIINVQLNSLKGEIIEGKLVNS